MSTVQDLYNFIQYRRDIQITADDLIHVADAAVRTIAKRLYAIGSDLITGQMEVDIFAEDAYTASMVFADSNPDTITDAASQFIVEGFSADQPITTTHASNPGPFRIATVAAGTLTLASTDSVVAATASTFTITSDDAYGYLPSDFWGLKDKPYVDGKTYALRPLPSQDVTLQYPSAGEPIYYRILGTKIYVIPNTSADYTIKGDYFQRPTALTVTTSTVPFNELFDDVIAEYIVRYFRGKESKSGVAETLLDKTLRAEVDLIANKHDRKAAVTFTQAVNWEL